MTASPPYATRSTVKAEQREALPSTSASPSTVIVPSMESSLLTSSTVMGPTSVVCSISYDERPLRTFTWHASASSYDSDTSGMAGSAQCVLKRRMAVLDRPEPPLTVSMSR